MQLVIQCFRDCVPHEAFTSNADNGAIYSTFKQMTSHDDLTVSKIYIFLVHQVITYCDKSSAQDA
jgi:hypothetical protein